MSLSLRKIERRMQTASSYQQWRELAAQHDRLSGAEEWKLIEETDLYDYRLIRKRMEALQVARKNNKVNQILFHLQEGLHGNLGRISNPELYYHSKLGTKKLIEEYLETVCECLNYVCDNDFRALAFKKKLDFFNNSGDAFGQSAIMLSGGATLGLFHIGVLKALYEYEPQLIPSVISGSSAGSIIAAVYATHKEEEFEQILQPQRLTMNAYKHLDWSGMLRGKVVLDGEHLEKGLEQNIPDITFWEAYQKTGKHLNITISPYDRHQNARLLNWKTSPNVLIRKAVLASCAIPTIFPPVTLWAKNVHDEKVPYIPGRKWVDGSIKDDLPVTRLSRLYGVNHTIVSQTNPHVVPFISRDEKRQHFSHIVWAMVAKNIQLNANLLLEVMQKNIHNNDLSLMLDKAQSVMRQKYIGDINLIPKRRLSSLLKAMKNPTVEDVQQFIESGERATWQKIEIIRNTTVIGRTFESCRHRLDEQQANKLNRLQLVSVK